jgi:hypothetical protein
MKIKFCPYRSVDKVDAVDGVIFDPEQYCGKPSAR